MPGTHDGSPPGPPDPQPALDLVRLGDALLHDGRRLQQNADLLEALGTFTMYSASVHVVLGQVAVAEVDPPLEVGVVRRHVVRADLVVDAVAGRRTVATT